MFSPNQGRYGTPSPSLVPRTGVDRPHHTLNNVLTDTSALPPDMEATAMTYDWQGVESQQKVEEISQITSALPSIFTKPLAFSYRNFNQYYSNYVYKGGERMEVGAGLVSAMLRWYFPKPKYEFTRLPIQEQSLIETVDMLGTFYYVVTVKNGYHKDSEMVLLVAIVTEPEFLKRPERFTPTNLHFPSSITSNRGYINIAGHQFCQGHIIVLGGQTIINGPMGGSRTRSTHPTWEFYSFNAGTNGNLSMIPFCGTDGAKDGLGTNIITLETGVVEKVHQQFLKIVERSSSTVANVANPPVPTPPPTRATSVANVLEPQEESPPLQAVSTPNNTVLQRISVSTPMTPTPEPDALAELEQYKLNKHGKLYIAKGGRNITNAESQKLKDKAAEFGYTFSTPGSNKRNNSGGQMASVKKAMK